MTSTITDGHRIRDVRTSALPSIWREVVVLLVSLTAPCIARAQGQAPATMTCRAGRALEVRVPGAPTLCLGETTLPQASVLGNPSSADPQVVAVQNDSVSAVLAFGTVGAGSAEPTLRQSQVLLRVANETLAKQRVAALLAQSWYPTPSQCEAGFLIADIQSCRRVEIAAPSGLRVRVSVGYLLQVASSAGIPGALVLVRSELIAR